MKNLKAKWITKIPETRLYKIPIPIIGLTGGIATGKSTIAESFRKNNIPVIDADRLVKNIYQTPEAKDFINNFFSEAIFNQKINFKKLREIAFSDQASKKLIEDYIYAKLPSEFNKIFLTFNNPSFIVYDVPLLFEKKLNELIDVSICIYAPKETQIKRLMSRDNSSFPLAEKIIDQQMDIEEKKNLSDIVLKNTEDLNELFCQFEELLNELFY